MATKRSKHDLSDAQLAQLREMKPVARFGKGRGGYTAMPHGYFTILAKKCSGWAQHFTVGYICDRTFGAFDEKTESCPEWTKLNLTSLARLTGLTPQAFWIALEDLVKRGLIERKGTGTTAQYRTTPEIWADAPDWDRKAKADAPEADATEADATEADATEADATEADKLGTTIAVESGKSSKPMVLSVAIKGMEQPVEMKFQPRNESGMPLVFSTSVASGVVRMTVLRGDEKANEFKLQLKRFSVTSDKNHQLSSLRATLKTLLSGISGKPLDEPFLQRIAATLGDAPIDEYARFAAAEIADMRKAKKPLKSGILEFLARQSRAKWDESAAERRAIAFARDAQIARLKALGMDEAAALSQINLWTRAGWDVDHSIRDAERATQTSNAAD